MADSELYVCRDKDGRIIGTATLAVVTGLVGRKGMVEDVVVDRAWRGQGIGRYLMLVLIDRAKELRLHALDLTSAPDRVVANGMYQALGFVLRATNVYRLPL